VPAGARARVGATRWGLMAGCVAMWIFVVAGGSLDVGGRAKARAAMLDLAATITRRDPHPRLLVYEGPMALYGLTGSYPPSPLLYNFHLYFPPENNTSPTDTATALAQDLAWRPNVVIAYHNWPAPEENARTAAPLRAYVRGCRYWGRRQVAEAVQQLDLDVWGDCAPD
jgi:hypothetical protein